MPLVTSEGKLTDLNRLNKNYKYNTKLVKSAI